MKLTRLGALKQSKSPLNVRRDVGHGVIFGAAIATEGEALGHGFSLDAKSIDQIAEYSKGTPGRWTHGGLSDDGLARHLGSWKDTSTREVKILNEETGQLELLRQAVGDFHFSKSAWSIKPDGLDVPAPQYLMDRAEEDPSTFGVSIVARFAMTETLNADGELESRVGHVLSDKDMKRGDFVADPAANPIGLSSGLGDMSEALEIATVQFSQLTKRVGPEEARARALSFLARLEEASGLEPKTQPQAAEAEENMNLKEALAALQASQAELATAKSELGSAKSELGAAQAAVSEKDKTIESLRAKEEKRVREEQDAYVASLNARAIEGGAAPIPAKKLEAVREQLELSEKGGRMLGEAILESALATASGGDVTELGDPDPKKKALSVAEAIAQGKPLSSIKE